MKKIASILVLLVLAGPMSRGQVKILFDATKAETAGSADWIVDADMANLNWSPAAHTGTSSSYYHSNAQQVPNPPQSGITASTPETYWKGGLSAWGVDCAKQGYQVETLPYNGHITYGDATNAQDLSHYNVFIVCEPNIQFTTAEKTALVLFVENGGGLFMVADHTMSDRNGDGWDSPAIWNDFSSTNPVRLNPFGITFDLQDFSGFSTNVVATASDPIIHGTMGNVTEVQWAGGTSMTLSTADNPTVKGVVFKTGTPAGLSSALVAYARYGSGKVAAIGDSSPCDDGTGNTSPSITLYDGYFGDAAGNHQKLLMNITIWLATLTSTSCAMPTGLTTSAITTNSADFSWSASTGATGYEYRVDNTSAAPTGSGTAITGTTYYSFGLAPGTVYYVHVRANCGSGNFSNWTTNTFTTAGTPSAVKNEATTIPQVYPNPVTNILHINNTAEDCRYSILSAMGNTVAHGDLLPGQNNIDVASLPHGYYQLEVAGPDHKTSYKLVKE